MGSYRLIIFIIIFFFVYCRDNIKEFGVKFLNLMKKINFVYYIKVIYRFSITVI